MEMKELNSKEYLDYEKRVRDKEALIYDSTFSEYHHIVEWTSLQKKISLKRGLILDAGCGTGRFSEKLVKMGFSVTGIDFSEESLKIARQRVGPEKAKFFSGSLLKLPFESESFDGILCSEVLSHILKEEDALQTLRELKRVLKPGGECIITAENYTLMRRLLRMKTCVNFSNTHFFCYTSREFYDLLRTVFKNEEIKEFVCILNLRLSPIKMGDRLWKYFKQLILKADLALERTQLSFLMGQYLVAKIVKDDSKGLPEKCQT